MSEEDKQKLKEYEKECRRNQYDNTSDEDKQKSKEYIKKSRKNWFKYVLKKTLGCVKARCLRLIYKERLLPCSYVEVGYSEIWGKKKWK